MTSQHVLGIDIVGPGIKGAMVDLASGELATDRLRIPTPGESTPGRGLQVKDRGQPRTRWGRARRRHDPRRRHARRHAHRRQHPQVLDRRSGGPDLEDVLGRDIFLMNDADAAGIAEVVYGAAKDTPAW